MPKQKTHSGAKKRFQGDRLGQDPTRQNRRRTSFEVKTSLRTCRKPVSAEVAPPTPRRSRSCSVASTHRFVLAGAPVLYAGDSHGFASSAQ